MKMIEDRDVIKFGSKCVTCFHSPGHTKGSMIYKIDSSIFTGDTIFIEGCGLCKFNGGSSSEMYDTVQLVKKFPKETLVWPGHAFHQKPGKKIKQLLNENIYFLIDKRKDFINFSDRRRNNYGFV